MLNYTYTLTYTEILSIQQKLILPKQPHTIANLATPTIPEASYGLRSSPGNSNFTTSRVCRLTSNPLPNTDPSNGLDTMPVGAAKTPPSVVVGSPGRLSPMEINLLKRKLSSRNSSSVILAVESVINVREDSYRQLAGSRTLLQQSFPVHVFSSGFQGVQHSIILDHTYQ